MSFRSAGRAVPSWLLGGCNLRGEGRAAALLAVLLVGCGQAVSGTPGGAAPGRPGLVERQAPEADEATEEASSDGPQQPWRREALLRWLRARHPEEATAWQQPPSPMCAQMRAVLQRQLDARLEEAADASRKGWLGTPRERRWVLDPVERIWGIYGACERQADAWAQADAGRDPERRPAASGPERRLVMHGGLACVLTAPDTLSCWGDPMALEPPVEQRALCSSCEDPSSLSSIAWRYVRKRLPETYYDYRRVAPASEREILRLKWGSDCARRPVVFDSSVGVIDCQGRLRRFHVLSLLVRGSEPRSEQPSVSDRRHAVVILERGLVRLALPLAEPPERLLHTEPEGASCLLGREPSGRWLSLPSLTRAAWCADPARDCAGWRHLPEGRPVSMPDLMTVRASLAHVCGLDAEGKVWCRGEGLLGQVGYCTVRSDWVQVPLQGRAVALDVAPTWSCAILEDGETMCWGSPGYGRYRTAGCGRMFLERTEEADLDEAYAAACRLCALAGGGRPVACGRTAASSAAAAAGSEAMLSPPRAASTAHLRRILAHPPKAPIWKTRRNEDPVEIALTDDNVGCVRTREGQVWCFRQGDTDSLSGPRLPRAAVELAAGEDRACVVLEDRTVWCWAPGHSSGRSANPMQVPGVRAMALPGRMPADSPSPDASGGSQRGRR